MTKDLTNIPALRSQIKTEVMDNKEVFNALASKTFKGLDAANIPQAILEGMMRGFTIQDFITKNVYATPFFNKREGRQEYSIVSSIDYVRKVAMRSGQSGKSAPTFEKVDGITEPDLSCSITVWKDGGDERGYTATVFFSEYTTGKNLWATKPRTMLAKVAEMHALRMAFPEELSQAYIEEEYEREHVVAVPEEEPTISDELRKQVQEATTEAKLLEVWNANKGLGKEFSKLITDQREFIKSAQEAEHTEAA